MVRIRGKEFLRYLVSWVLRNDIRDIVVCAGDLSERVTATMKSWAPEGVRLQLSTETQPLGTGGAVRHAFPLLDTEFILLNGDTYLPVSYGRILSRWQEVKARFDCLLAAYDNHDRVAPNDTAIDSSGLVVGYSKTNPEGMHCVNAGLIVIKKSVFERLPFGHVVSLEEEVFPRLISSRKMTSILVGDRYYDIGTPERLKAFEEYVDDHPEIPSTTG